jgi:hypothetical protein
MLRMCVYMHSRFVENHPIRILEDGPLIFEVLLSQLGMQFSLILGQWSAQNSIKQTKLSLHLKNLVK